MLTCREKLTRKPHVTVNPVIQKFGIPPRGHAQFATRCIPSCRSFLLNRKHENSSSTLKADSLYRIPCLLWGKYTQLITGNISFKLRRIGGAYHCLIIKGPYSPSVRGWYLETIGTRGLPVQFQELLGDFQKIFLLKENHQTSFFGKPQKARAVGFRGYNPFCLDRAGGRQREAQPKHVEFVESLNLVLNQRVQQVAKATIRLSNVLGLSEPSYSCKCLETAGNQLLCRKTESLNLGAIKCHCRMQPTIDGIIESASTVSSALAHTLSRI